MRKFYSLLVMLLACIMPALAQITSVDQLSNGNIYNLKVERGYLSYLASSNNLGGIDPATDDSQWAVYHYAGPVIRDGEETEVDGYYLFNISKYSFASTVGNNIVIAPTTEDPAAFNVEYVSGNGFKFECQQNSNWMQLGGSKQYVVTDATWKTWDAGSKWQITEIGELDENTAARIEKCIKGEDQLLTITLTNQTIDGDAISVTEMLGFAGDVLKISDIANYDYVEAVNEGTSEPVADRMITVSANEDENVYTVTYQAWPYVYIMGQDENGEGVGSDTEKYVKVGSELEAPAVLGYEVKSVFVNDEPATLPLIVTADMDQASIVFVYAEVQGGVITKLDKLSNTKGYVIACDYTDANSRGVLVYSEHYGKKMLNNADYKEEPTTYADADSTQFALYSDGEGNYYIYNLAAKLFIAKDPSANLLVSQNEPASWTISSWNGVSLPWHFQTENDQYTLNFMRNGANSLGATQVHPWGSTQGSADIGNRLYIYEGRDLTAEEIAEIENAIANVVPFSWVAYDPNGTELSSGAKQASAGDTIACPSHVPYSVDFEGSTLEGCHFAVNENGKQTPYIVIDEEAAEATAELQYAAATSLITNKADITNQSAYVIASRDRGPIVWASKPGSGGSRVRNNTDINLTSIDTEECNDTVQWAMYSLDQENFYFVNMAALAHSLEGTWDGGYFGIQEGGKMVLKDMAVAWQIEGWEEEDAYPFHFTTNDGANTLNLQGNTNTGLSWQVTVNSWNTKDPSNQIYLYKGRDLTNEEINKIQAIIQGENDLPNATERPTSGNYLFVEKLKTTHNQTIQIPIEMTIETENIVGFQCNILLPEGMEFVKNAKGNVIFTWNDDRTDGHTISSKVQADGSVKVAAASMELNPFVGKSGVMFYVNAIVPEGMSGEHYLKLYNIRMSDYNDEEIRCPDITSIIDVKKYTLGDINDDGEWSIVDVTMAIKAMLDENYIEAGDMNQDGEMSIVDVTTVIKYMLNEGPVSSAAVRSMYKVNENIKDERAFIESQIIEQGINQYLTIDFETNNEYVGFQTEISLPEGFKFYTNNKGKPSVTLNTDRLETHTVSTSLKNERTLRLGIVSMDLDPIVENDGWLFKVRVVADNNVVAGNHAVLLSDTRFSTEDEVEVKADNSTSYLRVLGTETISLTIPEGGFATFCCPFGAELKTDMKAYESVGIENNVVIMSEISRLEAGVPVIICGNPGIYEFVGDNSACEEFEYTKGFLTSSLIPVEYSEGYVLQRQETNGLGFYMLNQEKTIPAYRCVLHNDENASYANYLSVLFGETIATSVKSNNVKNLINPKVYTLEGKSVNSKSKGNIYVINGVKVSVK